MRVIPIHLRYDEDDDADEETKDKGCHERVVGKVNSLEVIEGS